MTTIRIKVNGLRNLSKGEIVAAEVVDGGFLVVKDGQRLRLSTKHADSLDALNALVPFVVRIELSTSPNGLDKLANDISQNSSITESDAVDFVSVVTDKSHGAKFDVIVRDNVPADLKTRVTAVFSANGHRAHAGELQVNSKDLALWLMREHNVLPSRKAA